MTLLLLTQCSGEAPFSVRYFWTIIPEPLLEGRGLLEAVGGGCWGGVAWCQILFYNQDDSYSDYVIGAGRSIFGARKKIKQQLICPAAAPGTTAAAGLLVRKGMASCGHHNPATSTTITRCRFLQNICSILKNLCRFLQNICGAVPSTARGSMPDRAPLELTPRTMPSKNRTLPSASNRVQPDASQV